jgi:hypothetical protein
MNFHFPVKVIRAFRPRRQRRQLSSLRKPTIPSLEAPNNPLQTLLLSPRMRFCEMPQPPLAGTMLYVSTGCDFLAVTLTAQGAAGSPSGRRSRKQSVACHKFTDRKDKCPADPRGFRRQGREGLPLGFRQTRQGRQITEEGRRWRNG